MDIKSIMGWTESTNDDDDTFLGWALLHWAGGYGQRKDTSSNEDEIPTASARQQNCVNQFALCRRHRSRFNLAIA